MSMANNEIWQRLLSLESRDVVTQWFSEIHSRDLNARRAKEINAAAKQSREYFKNAANAAFTVRPLLTFYGVASLSRAFALLLKRSGGEEGLTGSHGLETLNWAGLLNGDVTDALRSLPTLRIRTTAGLFTDFIKHTENRMSIHVNSSKVDWRFCYDVPDVGCEISLDELFARLPDLREDFSTASGTALYSPINEMTYSPEKGFKARVKEDAFSRLKSFFEEKHYEIGTRSDWCSLSTDAANFRKSLPLFTHSYVKKTFGSIPSLYISKPFNSGARFSQLGLTYMLSYILGMLVRYFPTHWITLVQNEMGDTWWPTINAAQNYVEVAFPELVIEMIDDLLEEKRAALSL